MARLPLALLMAALAGSIASSAPAFAHGNHDTGSPPGAEGQSEHSWWLDLVPRAAAADGIPVGLVEKLGPAKGPVMVGWAADGFPIYVDPSARPSWRLKAVQDPGGPPGKPDGTYVRDYEYEVGLGDLDQCNGRTGATPEFPKGTYHYVLTAAFPHIPRCFVGLADSSFVKQGGSPPFGGPGRPPPPRPGMPGMPPPR